MNALIVRPTDEKEALFLKALLAKLGYPVRELSDEELEDAGLLTAMVSEKKEDYVAEKEIRDVTDGFQPVRKMSGRSPVRPDTGNIPD